MLVYVAVIGVIGGLGAQVFSWLIDQAHHLFLHGIAGYDPPGIATEGGNPVERVGRYGRWLIPLSTTIGGLVSGLLVFRFAPEAEGHGTDSAVKAFHHQDGRIRGRVPIVKGIASAITIGSGFTYPGKACSPLKAKAKTRFKSFIVGSEA